MDKFRKYYSTCEFSELCGVNKKILFHYNNIDLLKPEKSLCKTHSIILSFSIKKSLPAE